MLRLLNERGVGWTVIAVGSELVQNAAWGRLELDRETRYKRA